MVKCSRAAVGLRAGGIVLHCRCSGTEVYVREPAADNHPVACHPHTHFQFALLSGHFRSYLDAKSYITKETTDEKEVTSVCSALVLADMARLLSVRMHDSHPVHGCVALTRPNG